MRRQTNRAISACKRVRTTSDIAVGGVTSAELKARCAGESGQLAAMCPTVWTSSLRARRALPCRFAIASSASRVRRASGRLVHANPSIGSILDRLVRRCLTPGVGLHDLPQGLHLPAEISAPRAHHQVSSERHFFSQNQRAFHFLRADLGYFLAVQHAASPGRPQPLCMQPCNLSRARCRIT